MSYDKDAPGGPEIKNPPCDAGDLGLSLRQGTKIPHAQNHNWRVHVPQGKILDEAMPLRPKAARLINQFKKYSMINHNGKEYEKECVFMYN